MLANLPADQFEELLQDLMFDRRKFPGRWQAGHATIATGTDDPVSVKRRREDRLFELQLIRERNLARAPAPPSAAAAV